MKTIEEKALDNKIEQVELEELMYDEFYELIAEVKNVGRRIGYNQAIDSVLKLMYDHKEEIYIGVFEDIEKLKK